MMKRTVGNLIGYSAAVVLMVGAGRTILTESSGKNSDLEDTVICAEAARLHPENAVYACQTAVKENRKEKADALWQGFMRSEPDASYVVLKNALASTVIFGIAYSLVFGYDRRITELEDKVKNESKPQTK